MHLVLVGLQLAIWTTQQVTRPRAKLATLSGDQAWRMRHDMHMVPSWEGSVRNSDDPDKLGLIPGLDLCTYTPYIVGGSFKLLLAGHKGGGSPHLQLSSSSACRVHCTHHGSP